MSLTPSYCPALRNKRHRMVTCLQRQHDVVEQRESSTITAVNHSATRRLATKSKRKDGQVNQHVDFETKELGWSGNQYVDELEQKTAADEAKTCHVLCNVCVYVYLARKQKNVYKRATQKDRGLGNKRAVHMVPHGTIMHLTLENTGIS